MEKYAAIGGGVKFKGPDGLWYYINSKDVARYPKRFDCVQGRQTVMDCDGRYRADGPGLDQLHMIRPHKPNCQLLLKPAENDLMKDAMKLAVQSSDNRSFVSIYEDLKSR